MKTIYLQGELAERFTPQLTAEVSTFRDVMHCLEANYPEFRSYLIEGMHQGQSWSIQYGEDWMTEDDILNGTPIGKRDIVISPEIHGADRAIAMIGLGIVAIAAGVFTGGIGFLGISSTSAILLGSTMVVSGILGLMSTPKLDEEEQDEAKPSAFFNGGANVETQGGILPVVYGERVLVGSTVVSFGIRTFTELDDE